MYLSFDFRVTKANLSGVCILSGILTLYFQKVQIFEMQRHWYSVEATPIKRMFCVLIRRALARPSDKYPQLIFLWRNKHIMLTCLFN